MTDAGRALPRLLSVVVPVRDEEASIDALLLELDAALTGFAAERGIGLEWILVDDASRDASLARMREWERKDERLRVVALAAHAGQASALGAGFRAARGDAIATLDADGQNDPADLPRLVERLAEGDADAVCGVRATRRDGAWRRLSSRAANAARRAVLGDAHRDIGCALRVVRARHARALALRRGLHRFLPVLLALEGARVVELPVAHRPRRFGASKYTARNRVREALVDLVYVARRQRRARRERARDAGAPSA
ncbi:MAG: glycosyltransferase [Myxococcota bacterium]